MPYDGEYAQYKPLGRLVQSERVHQLLSKYEIRSNPDVEPVLPTFVKLSDLNQNGWKPDWILAIDGSHHEVPVKNGYPSAEASYITVASVLLDVAKVRELDQQRPVDPKIFRTVEQAEAIDCVLPGSNVIYKGETSAKSSLRKALFELLSAERLADKEESLLDTYEVLLDHKPQRRDQKCPYEDCPLEEGTYHPQHHGRYECSCEKKAWYYSTDALRIHERMNPEGANGLIFSEVMQVLERLWLIHILRVFEAQQLLSVLKRIAIVVDGPLAVYGQPAWLSGAIYKELARINEAVKAATGGLDILLLGIEKSGQFVEHVNSLDKNEDGSPGRFPDESALLFDDTYIKKHIVFSESSQPYGFATYFGRKFAYKTKPGALIIGSLPFLIDSHRDVKTAHPNQFPRLADALSMLNQLASTRYMNAVTPLVSAHAEASIPLHLGNKVLQRLAREIISEQRP